MPSFVLQKLLLPQSGSSSLTLQHSSSNGPGQRIKVGNEAETAAYSSSYQGGYQSGSHPCPPPHATSATELNVGYGISCLSRSTSVTGIFFLSDLQCGHQYYSTGVFRKLVAALSNQTRRRCFRSPRKSARSMLDAFWVCWGLHPSLAQCPRPLIPSTDLSSHIPASWVHFLHTQHSLVVSGGKQIKTTIQYTWVLHRGRPKIEKVTQHKTLSWNGTFLAWFPHPCQFHFLLKEDFRQTWLHLNIWGFIFFKVSRAHVGRNPKKLQQLVCEKSFPLRGPHVLAKQLITNCGTEMLSGSRAGGNLVLRSLP